ncbi:MAG: hypothetical protein KJT03_23635, partial [Verrucomicrobiae bacterium]|nr:hypothetical protein [Verrucomicrobiae bacterium]
MKKYPKLRLSCVAPSCLLLLVTSLLCMGHAGHDFQPSRNGSTSLASVLLDKYPYLVSGDQRAWLERELRSAEQVQRGDLPEVEFDKLLLSIVDARTIDLKQCQSSGTNHSFDHNLPGDQGGILFKVSNGAGPTTYKLAPLDLAISEKSVSVPLPNSGTTWVLLDVENVPDGTTVWYVSFDTEDTVSRIIPIRLHAPKTGRLAVDILSDDTGKATPAIVQLQWLQDGSYRAPGSAIDYTLQFDSQAGTRELIQGSRLVNLPGIDPGHFWVCSGPFDMALPPGEWKITILRGLEHLPVMDTLSVVSGQTTTKTYRPRRWVDMSDQGWYSGDDHVHMQIQSNADADRLMTWAKAEDIHLLNVLEMGDHERTFF